MDSRNIRGASVFQAISAKTWCNAYCAIAVMLPFMSLRVVRRTSICFTDLQICFDSYVVSLVLTVWSIIVCLNVTDLCVLRSLQGSKHLAEGCLCRHAQSRN
jgi:hypothetical protein